MKVYSRGGVGVYTDYRENIIVDADHPILAWKARKRNERLRALWFPVAVQSGFPEGFPYLASENSEDVLSWNIFRSLQMADKMCLLSNVLGMPGDVEEVYFWQHAVSRRTEEPAPEIQATLDEMEPWGQGGARQQTETDVIVRGRRHFVMVESKLGKPGQAVRAWSRSSAGMRPQYQRFMNALGISLFKDDFDYAGDGNRFYQLFRNYVLGAALSIRWNAQFSLVAIVNALNANVGGSPHGQEFGRFQSLLRLSSNTSLRSWQEIWEEVRTEPALEALQSWLVGHNLLGLCPGQNHYKNRQL